jgi:DNA invertase Pin-like site-specific DNA recombinase
MSRIGYARIRSRDRRAQAEITALEEAGCGEVVRESVSSRRRGSRQLARAIAHMRQGDVLVVWSIESLAPSPALLGEVLDMLAERGAGLHALSESIEAASLSAPSDRQAVMIACGIEEYAEGMAGPMHSGKQHPAARRGRKRILSPADIDRAGRMLAEGMTATAVAIRLGVSRSTFYRHFPKARSSAGGD